MNKEISEAGAKRIGYDRLRTERTAAAAEGLAAAPAVFEQEELLQKSVAHLHERIDFLAGRLRPVLSPKIDHRPDRDDTIKEAEALSALAERLIVDRKMIDQAARLIEALTENLEI